jgi:fucokinase / fucose-1-phosphate guanylyltransferase
MAETGKEIDWLIVTAASRAQARGYRAELRARRGTRLLQRVGRTLVVPDVGDKRIGSGASTLVTLARIATHLLRGGKRATSLAELFAGQRIVIVHCGGDSRRLPAYAAQGKVFLPLPYEVEAGEEASLFDLILADLLALDIPAEGRAIVASGDVFLDLSPHAPRFDRAGLVGVAWATNAKRGARHGVYVLDDAGTVTDFLQKPTREQAAAAGALSAADELLVDTGILALDPATIDCWLSRAGVGLEDGTLRHEPGLLADLLAGQDRQVDLYGDMLCEGAGDESWLIDIDFSAATVPDCAFLHLGTSRELIDCLVRDETTIERHGFQQHIRSAGVTGSGLETACVYNSVIEARCGHAGPDVLIEACHVSAPLHLAGENIVVGLPKEATRPIDLSAGIGLVCLPVGDSDWAAVCFGLSDDCKTSREGGGTFCNRPLEELSRRAGASAEALWDEPESGKQSLWNANLWQVGPIEEVLGQALALAGAEPLCSELLNSERCSLAALMTRANHRRLLQHRRSLRDEVARAATP